LEGKKKAHNKKDMQEQETALIDAALEDLQGEDYGDAEVGSKSVGARIYASTANAINRISNNAKARGLPRPTQPDVIKMWQLHYEASQHDNPPDETNPADADKILLLKKLGELVLEARRYERKTVIDSALNYICELLDMPRSRLENAVILPPPGQPRRQ
jgi:hypothetical protein